MKHLPLISSFCSTPRRKLYMAIAAQMIASAGAHASPNGGAVVGGDGIIEQSGLDTTIIQNTNHLAIDWQSFNIAAEERVQFIQPDADSVALNRILGNEASKIFGRLDANGHVILMNPNGVLFGEGASVNVGGLVASGLNINADDFMNGDYVLQAVDGKDGTVINKGIINAATGGNIALIGKQVDNQGLISAKLGAVTLAAGKEAVLTFDNQGLLGVRVSKEILQDELGIGAAVSNSGDINAEGGQILMTGSVSQDIFSQAVNAEGLNAKTSVVMHEDGSFTLGAGADVVNAGTISTSSETTDAGQIVVLGENVNSSGAIFANSKTANAAGNIEIHSRDTTLLTSQSHTSATNEGAGTGGQVKILGDRVGVLDQSQIDASGTHGGGDINIGGGFQGKETQLRNATRTVIGKDTLIESNAFTDGDGGDVIVWADETTSFTGEINVRGGELGGDGGFVEVSGKENLRFLGNVDRTAVRGENGTLLLDPEAVVIVPENPADHDEEIADGLILLSDEPADGSSAFLISDGAVSRALESGDVFIRASSYINAIQEGVRISAGSPNNTSSLVLESGGSITLTPNTDIELGSGNFIALGSIDGLCDNCTDDILVFTDGAINTQGNIYFFSSRHTVLTGTNIGRNLTGDQTSVPSDLYLYGGDASVIYLDNDLEVSGSIRVETLAQPTLNSIVLPSGTIYEVPKLKTPFDNNQQTIIDTDSALERKAEITVGEGFFIDSDFTGGPGVEFTQIVLNSSTENAQFIINSQDAVYLPEIGYDSFGNPSTTSISVNISSESDIYADENISTLGGSLSLTGASLSFGESTTIDTTGLVGQGDILLEAVGDISLGQIASGGDVNAESVQGTVSIGRSLDVAGETKITAEDDISFSETSIFYPENNVFLSAGNDINFAASSDLNDPGFIGLAASNPTSFIFSAGRNIVIDSTVSLGAGDFIASAGTRAHLPSDFPVEEASLVVAAHEGPGIHAKAIDTNGKIIFRSAHFIDTPILESGANGSDGYIGYYTNGSVVLPHYANSNGDFEVFNFEGAENLVSSFQLSDGSVVELPDIISFEAVDTGYVGWYGSGTETTLATSGGNFYIQSREIQHWGGNAVDVSFTSGHGNITLIAEGEITAPPIQYANSLGQGADESSEIRLSGSKIRIDRDIDFNNAGTVNFSLEASGDVIIGVVEDDAHYLELSAFDRRVGGKIFDSTGGDSDQLNIQITSTGKVFQKYNLFTGGGNYSATASDFQFNDLVVLNTDFANETQNALSGTGNVSIQSTSDQAELILPSITTQTDCIDTTNCGTLNVSAASVANKGDIVVFGDATFEAIGEVGIRSDYLIDTGLLLGIRNIFGGHLYVNSGSAAIFSTGDVKLGEWDVTGTVNISAGNIGDGFGIVAAERLNIGGDALFGSDYIEIKNSDTHLSGVMLLATEVDVDYSGDLDLIGLYVNGGQSTLKVGGNLSVRNDGAISSDTERPPNILDAPSAAPIIFDVAGNIQLLGERNRLSSIQILNAQNVEIFNNGELTLNGVNAENLSLNVLGDIEQTAALNVTGNTNISASVGANINLLDPLNDFNSLSVRSPGPAIINIADVNNISLADIDLNGASQGGALSMSAAAITQGENGRILLQDATRLNLQADYITLGANGTASVDILGSTLNGVFTRDLNIQGVVRGGAGVAGTGVAGFYFNGSVEDNFFEVADGASITGDFISGSKIFLGDGNDTASFAGDVAILVEGGSGQDTFLIETPNLSIAQILGNEDQDILVGPDAPNVWNITGNGEGTLSDESAVVGFSDIESLRGGSQIDDFIVESPDVVVQLDGGDGLDSLSANLNDAIVNNQWIVDGVNSGSLNELVLFSSVENLIGNDGDDIVTFSEGAQIGDVSTGLGDDEFTLATDITTGLLDAGDGNDTLNLNGLNSIYTYLAERIGGDGNYTEINFEIENSEGGSKTIVGVDGYDAEWIIDADGRVTISALQGGTTETNRFTGVTRVEGASGNDTFILQGGYLADRIVGGQGGNDSLIADTGFANSWLIDGQNSGSIQVAESGREQLFEAITNLVGGADNDSFRILGGANFNGTIAGGLGTNSLEVSDSTATSVWTIGSTSELRVESLNNGVSQLTFTEIQTLVGNDNEDVLDLSEVALSVNLETQAAGSFDFQNMDRFVTSGGASITGANYESVWDLNSDRSAVVYIDNLGIERRAEFSGFSIVYGGNVDDRFVISGILPQTGSGGPAVVIGNAGIDTVEIQNQGTDSLLFMYNGMDFLRFSDASDFLADGRDRYEFKAELDLAGADAYMFGDIESYVGSDARDLFFTYSALASREYDGSSGEDYLFAWAYAQSAGEEKIIWNVTSDYAGNIDNVVNFRNVENLYSDFAQISNDVFNVTAGATIGTLFAGAGDDAFVVGEGSTVSTILGGEGLDTIESASPANSWQLNSTSGSLNSTTFSGIEILTGGSGSDNFTFTSATSEITQIDGGAGVNSLTAFNQDNAWDLSASASTLNGEFQFSNITNLIGGAGADIFSIIETVPALNIDGGAGANTLIANSGNTLNNTWIIDGVNSGTLNTSVQFSNTQDLQGNDGVDTVTFAADSAINNISTFGGNDLIFMASGVQAGLLDGGLGDNLLNLGDLNTVIDILGSTLEGGDAIYEEINFTPVTDGDGLFTVRGVAGIDAEWLLDGDDSVLIRFTDTEGIAQERRYTNVSRMEGTDGNNRFVLTADGSLSGQIVGGTSLTAANDQGNTWLIDGADSGTLTSATNQQLVFEGIASLIGGTGADIFEIATGGSITGSIDGGIGEDSLTISDVLALNNWQLGAQSSTELVNQFSGIENLLGNINSDIFNVVGTTEVTSLDGGEGGNILIWSAGDLMLNLDQSTANQSLSFIDIRSFAADGENNTLVGAATDNTWIIGEQFSEGNDDGIGLTGTTIGEGMVNSVFFTGFNNLVGGVEVDTFRGMNANGIWQIGNYDNPNLNTLTYGNQQIVFSGMEKLIGGAGSDEFSAELVGVTAIDGGLGTNQLAATGAVDNEWSIGGSNSGSFNNTLVFEEIQSLVGNAGDDTFTFAANSSIGNINSGAGEDTFILANNITAGILDGGDGLDILDRAGLNSIVTYLREVIGGDAVYTSANIETETSSGGSTTVVGVDGYSAEWRITGDGTLSVTATDADGVAVTNEFTGVTRAEGGAGFDAFVLLEEGTIAEGVIGSGNDYLQASEMTNIWTINAADGGELAVQEFGTRLAFQGIANLYGGNGSDLFEVTAGGSVSGSIYGGGGVDTLAIIDTTVTNNWQLGETNVVGLVADFREIETLIGNDNNDTFTFNGPTAVTSIDGEAGDNAVIWQMADVVINLGTSQINELINFGGINSFDADSAFENTLIGADESNAWTLNGAASGAVTNTQGEFAFNGFQYLVGGAMADAFTLTAEATGFVSINGEAGADSLTAADQLNQWVLDAEGGELNGLRFANIEALTGGALQDNFVLADAASQAQIIDGGAGANRLTAYDQVNVWNVSGDNAGDVTGLASFSNIQTLIGGAEADTFTLAAGVNLSEIYAGAGNDLFVIGAGVAADNFYGEAGDDSVEVEVGLELSGVLDGGSGGETDGDYINLSKYTLLDATAELESVLGFAFLNFERIDEPNTQGVYFGGDGTNFWYITGANEGRLEIRDGEDAGVYEFSGVHSLLGGEGEDIFIFANDAAAVSTLIDGGEGAGANTLDLSAQGLINEWLLSGANSGLVSNASNTSGNIFTNIAYLIGGSNQDVFDLQTGGSIAGAIDGGLGGDELWVSVEQTNNWQLGGVAGHSVTGIASFTNIEGLTGGAGADNFDILAELTDVTQLNGGAGSDAVNFLYEAPVTVDLADGLAAGLRVESVERFTTADARSVFTGVESAATWTVDGADQGSIQYLRPADGNLINVAFDGFGNLIGGAGGDQFVVAQDGSLSGTLSGGGGRNTVDLQEVVGEIHIATSPDAVIADGLAKMTLADIDQLIGNGRTWLYGASDRSYTWTIDGIRSGQMTSTLVDDSNRLLAFENLSAIRGGTHDDIFQVIAESPLLSLDGGSAVTADLVDYSRVNGNLRISLADALTGQNGELTGVEGIRGNNSGPDSLHSAELAGPDSGAVWSIGSLVGDGLADGVNDGRVAFDEQTITFVDFNVLTGGAGVDTFNQVGGIVLGTLNGGAGDDVFNVDMMGANAGTAVVGGAGTDSIVLRGGDETGLMTYTAAAGGGEFDYSLADVHYKVSHQGVEGLRDRTLAATLDVRGSSAAETFSLANDRFWVNGGDVVEYSSKRDIAVRSGINDIIEIADNLVVENSLALANGTVIANDPANNSITTGDLILDSTRDVGLSSARLRTSVDNLLVRNSAGDIYLQEQNGVNLAEFNANGIFDLRLLNGDLTNSAPLTAADVVRITAENGDVTLASANQLRDDVAISGNRVELHNASTLTLVEINAEELYLRTQRGIEGDGPITVGWLTDIDAGGDVLLDFATNDFNQLRVTNAVNLTVVDQNAIELLDINASGTVVVRSTNTVTLNDNVTGANGVDVSSGAGSINQNGTISTNSGSVVVSAGNGEVNLGEDAKIVSNGGSVNINAGAGNVNMGGDTRIAANGGDVNIVAADSVVVAEVVSSGNVNINAGGGSVSDGNGGATNVAAGGLQSSSNTGFGNDDALETNVGNIDITTNTGNVAVSNSGNVTVDNVSTGQGDISLVNQGDVELGGGSVVAENGANGGSVNIDVSQGSVSQSGSTSVPAVKGGGVVVINAPDGAIGDGGGLRVDAPFVEIIAAIKAGDIFVNPGADKIEYFSGSFKFDDQLLAVEPLEDINPAIFANVKSYFFNDISLLLPRDQLYDEDEEE